MHRISEITETVKSAAHAAGFDLSGIAPATDAPEQRYFPEWIAAGHAGEMRYLEARNGHRSLKRESLAHIAPWARSVVVCAINYDSQEPYSTQVHSGGRGWISRYAWGREDYHESVMRRLRRVEAAIRTTADAGGGSEVITRCYVDTGPVVERIYAKY